MTEYQIRDSIIQECVNICDELVQAWNQELLASTHGDGREHHMAEATNRCAERILALKAASNAVEQTSHRTALDREAIIEECAKVCDELAHEWGSDAVVIDLNYAGCDREISRRVELALTTRGK
ncbi:hypothetical protein [Burkholderia singularis]|uniref:hypothetical protein n=1 Tax=Burkholderia singularis TaxID=1503053 RepID=UPI00117E4144|nr:hypothetical protein [Burkholderia singularis]